MHTLEITTKVGCLMDCLYCPQDKLKEAYYNIQGVQKYILDFNDFKNAISTVPNSIRIDFSGMCEPFLNDRTTDMILYAYSKGHKIAIFTTAIGITKEHIDKLKNVYFETFEIHLQDEKGYSHIPQSEELNYIISSIKKDFNNVLTGDLTKIKIISRAGNLQSVNNEKKSGPLQCSRELERFVLMPNGHLYLCCMDYSLQHFIGNLFKSTYSYITDGEHQKQFKEIKTLLASEEGDIICRRCEFAINKN